MIEARMVQVCTCGKCGREFIPLRCPECKSPNWNKAESVARPGRPRKVKEVAAELEDTGPEISSDDVPEEYLPNEGQSVAKVEEWSFADREAHRKMGHALGCNCYDCEGIRRMMRSSPETGKQSAHEKTPRKKGKKTAGR